MSGWRLIVCKVVSFLYDIFCRSAAKKAGINPHFSIKEPPPPKYDDVNA